MRAGCVRCPRRKGLYPFDRGAFAAMLEYGVRQAGRRNKVTARFVDIADLAREAHYNAAAAGESVVRAAHVRGALSSKMERHNLIETRMPRNDPGRNLARGCRGIKRRPGERT